MIDVFYKGIGVSSKSKKEFQAEHILSFSEIFWPFLGPPPFVVP